MADKKNSFATSQLARAPLWDRHTGTVNHNFLDSVLDPSKFLQDIAGHIYGQAKEAHLRLFFSPAQILGQVQTTSPARLWQFLPCTFALVPFFGGIPCRNRSQFQRERPA